MRLYLEVVVQDVDVVDARVSEYVLDEEVHGEAVFLHERDLRVARELVGDGAGHGAHLRLKGRPLVHDEDRAYGEGCGEKEP